MTSEIVTGEGKYQHLFHCSEPSDCLWAYQATGSSRVRSQRPQVQGDCLVYQAVGMEDLVEAGKDGTNPDERTTWVARSRQLSSGDPHQLQALL